jgi:hypothetical protein
MEFKGTKENWVNVVIDIADFKQVVVGVDKGKAICHLWFEYSEGITDEIKANALLISKAPEMLEMLKEILESQESGEVFHSYKIEQLIKEATEI